MSGSAMLLEDKVSELSTVENAKAYSLTSEKFTFCIDLLEISAHNFNSDYWVNALEDNFGIAQADILDIINFSDHPDSNLCC